MYQVTEMSNIFEIYFAAHFLKYEPIFEIIIFEIFLKSIFEMKLKSHFEIMCIFHRLIGAWFVEFSENLIFCKVLHALCKKVTIVD